MKMPQCRVTRDTLFVLAVFAATVFLFFLPTGFERPLSGEAVKATVLTTDNSGVRQHGIVRTGDQALLLHIESGERAGQKAQAVNHLFGKLELDKMFTPGDSVLALMDATTEHVLKITVQDRYRLHVEAMLFGLFALLLLWYAGATGARTLLSFVFTAVAVWKVLLPGLLKGWNPLLASLGITSVLCFVIIFLVSGFDRKGFAAYGGALAGLLFTGVLSVVFGHFFAIHGAVRPFSETLLYSGFGHLDLTGFFLGGIFLASSGAVMDLSMDIAAAMHELQQKTPHISRLELMRSGNSIGRMVVGTMTTTLLLAYTGSFTSMLMVFVAQGTPISSMLNLQYVAAELLHTLVGSFGLVTVAPFTALLGSWVLTRPQSKQR